MYNEPWSEDEIAIIMANYPERGGEWEGWEMLLPNRTKASIAAKANRMHVYSEVKKPRKKYVRRKKQTKEPVTRIEPPKPTPDPMERVVLRERKQGMTLAQIDKAHRWHSGRAYLILTEMWKRVNGSGKVN